MQNTSVVPFQFKKHEVRVVEQEGAPWFVAKDVCNILGLDNITWALNGLDDDEQALEKLKSGCQHREMKIISESGLYCLIFKSRKSEAKKFRRWVTHEVLPSIRKTGGYISTSGLTYDQQAELKEAVNRAVRISGQNRQTAYNLTWNRLKKHFGVERYKEIPAARFHEAMALLEPPKALLPSSLSLVNTDSLNATIAMSRLMAERKGELFSAIREVQKATARLDAANAAIHDVLVDLPFHVRGMVVK